jgi:hypothetical protein
LYLAFMRPQQPRVWNVMARLRRAP